MVERQLLGLCAPEIVVKIGMRQTDGRKGRCDRNWSFVE